MLTKTPPFNVQELFDSLPLQEQQRINRVIAQNAETREEERYLRLHNAEISKNKLIEELEEIKSAIAENDAWFSAAKEKNIDVAIDELNSYKTKAQKLYSRKKLIVDELLPESDSAIDAIVSQIEAEELKESLLQKQDLEKILIPIHEKRKLERRKIFIAQQEVNKQKSQKEIETLLNQLRADKSARQPIPKEEQSKKRREEIYARVHARNIPYLVHFTPITNVNSILRDGLQSRNLLDRQNFVVTDQHRLDGWLDWISTSVSFPNYRMFYKKRESLRNISGWAVILIKKEVLWELDCRFLKTNASSYMMRICSASKCSTVQAFDDMFDSEERRISIPDFYTTDPQAEVMIRNHIPRNYIEMIAVKHNSHALSLDRLADIPIEVRPYLFDARSDYQQWCRLNSFNYVIGSF